MGIRYSDSSVAKNDANDFVARRRIPTWQMLSGLFGATLLLCIFLSHVVVDPSTFGFIIFFIIAALGSYAIFTIQNGRDVILATEFQNALFSSALGFSNKFCLIVKNDGTITYLDRSFQDMFPSFIREPRRSIDILLEHGQVSKDQRKTIFAAIERAVYDKVIFDLTDARGQAHKIIMSIEPIPRPSGFLLLRGREFIEKRNAAKISDDGSAKMSLINSTSITLFSHVMDSMDLGLYMASSTGTITYTNPVLEQWLKFDSGEILSRNMTVQELASSAAGNDALVAPDNFEGETTLQRKIGGTVNVFVNQKALRDSEGQIISYTGLVHYLGENTIPDDKKKLW